MHLPRKLMIAALSLAVPVSLVNAVDVDPGWAAPSAAAPGTISCTGVTGKVAFNPTLEAKGDSNTETSTTTITLTHCRTSKGTAPSKGVVTSTTKTTTTNNSADSCAGLAGSAKRATAFTIAWTHSPSISKSVVSFSGFTPTLEPVSKDAGFVLPNTGGKVSVTGSFTGTDGGKTSHAVLYVAMTAAQIGAACAHLDGIASLKFDAGSVTLK
jgi:hypothetical protein